jgi:hypothetical protein
MRAFVAQCIIVYVLFFVPFLSCTRAHVRHCRSGVLPRGFNASGGTAVAKAHPCSQSSVARGVTGLVDGSGRDHGNVFDGCRCATAGSIALRRLTNTHAAAAGVQSSLGTHTSLLLQLQTYNTHRHTLNYSHARIHVHVHTNRASVIINNRTHCI